MACGPRKLGIRFEFPLSSMINVRLQLRKRKHFELNKHAGRWKRAAERKLISHVVSVKGISVRIDLSIIMQTQEVRPVAEEHTSICFRRLGIVCWSSPIPTMILLEQSRLFRSLKPCLVEIGESLEVMKRRLKFLCLIICDRVVFTNMNNERSSIIGRGF